MSSDAEDAVWEREKVYWDRFSSKDPAIVDLCHKEFRGWTSQGVFMDRDGLAAHVKNRQDSGRRGVGNPRKVRVVGSVALCHFADGEGRVCHTWVQVDDSWLLLGGISCGPADSDADRG
jgi:hypothetical protein